MPATGPERIRRREGQDAAGTDAIGAGRLRDQAKRAVAADGLPLADEGGFAVAEWRRAENRRAPVPTARPTAPAAERSDAKCTGPGSDHARTQSNDCGAVWAQCGTAHFAREYRWGGGPRTLTGTPHKHHTRHRTNAKTHNSCRPCAVTQFTNPLHAKVLRHRAAPLHICHSGAVAQNCGFGRDVPWLVVCGIILRHENKITCVCRTCGNFRSARLRRSG